MKLKYLSSIADYSGQAFWNKLNKNQYFMGKLLLEILVRLPVKMYIVISEPDPKKRDDKILLRFMSKHLNNHLRRSDLKAFQTKAR